MRETAEFRVNERFASLLFADDEGDRLTEGIRRVRIATNDPRYARIGDLQHDTQQRFGEPFFYGWNIRRVPGDEDRRLAKAYLMSYRSYFAPNGEVHGAYDESVACPVCGSGARQVGPLVVKDAVLPKRADVATALAGEVFVSRRFVDLAGRECFSGVSFAPVRLESGRESDEWSQLLISNASDRIVPPTQIGVEPFDLDEQGEYRCPMGDLAGLNVLSALHLSVGEGAKLDVRATQQFVGVRRGLLRPKRFPVVSPRFADLVTAERLRGVEFEVAYVE